MKTIITLICLSLWCLGLAAQTLTLPRDTVFLPQKSFRIVPDVDASTAYFAYLRRASDNSQTVSIGRVVEAYPQPKSVPVRLLRTVDGVGTEIFDLIASPDNQFIAIHSVQFGSDFIDLDFDFYNLHTGTHLGLRNEHSFTDINKATYSSERYEEFLVAESNLSGDSVELLRGVYDFYLNVESGYIDVADYGWNEDGTFSITYVMEVFVTTGSGSTDYDFFVGQEEFTKNYTVSGAGVGFGSYGPATPAIYPLSYSLTPRNGPTQKVRFNGELLLMGVNYSFGGWGTIRYYSFGAYMVEGVIPRRYRIEYY